MNSEEAKFILTGYRPGEEDAGDEKFAEALTQAEHDPALAEWFAQECRFDAAMSEAVCASPVPSGLRAQILAGGKISRPTQWRVSRRALAAAAIFAFFAGLAGIWLLRHPGLDSWQRDALALVNVLGTETMPFDLRDQDAAVLQQFLTRENAPAPAAIPASLEAMPALGCKTFRSHDRQVSIICFQMRSGEVIHLVVTAEEKLSRPPPGEPRFVHDDAWRTASWSAHGRAYMLATKASERELREVLATIAQAGLPESTTI